MPSMSVQNVSSWGEKVHSPPWMPRCGHSNGPQVALAFDHKSIQLSYVWLWQNAVMHICIHLQSSPTIIGTAMTICIYPD